MSYCRFTNSDVYAYECEGGVQFWAGKGLDRLCRTFCEAYMYAKELRDKHGLNVPDTAIEELLADAVEEGGLMVEILTKLDEGAYLPTRAHDTDAGADIRTPRTFVLPAGGSVTIKTGVHVQLPHGTVAMLKSKSGLNVNHGIIGEGVVDEGYDGEIRVKLYNMSENPHIFKAGDKIIQMCVMPVLYPTYVQVKEIESGDRGSDGFGSTGR